jgi:DeoR/GlpR family transcriptional regulator of sugar metabolism
VQAYRIDDPLNEALRAVRGTMEPFDGISQLWWKDRQDLERSMSTREGQQAWKRIREDEARFIDASRSSLWLAKENIVLGER